MLFSFNYMSAVIVYIWFICNVIIMQKLISVVLLHNREKKIKWNQLLLLKEPFKPVVF